MEMKITRNTNVVWTS